ncbi:dynein heavy chain 1, axonemal [Oreochromis niloticus]|uniref:dynein heavy chain 1, axonemal n=1 Tax=Oreochromis niloticus TaxID=8128 RepID=UPI000904A90B|nr:dynein heavy chain 1, axonemal [Oreochromis niloticus]
MPWKEVTGFFFQNCHLAPSWMPTLERLIENINPLKVHKNFRLWLTSLPSNKFPVSVLQKGSKMTIEPPRGIKANLQKTYMRLTNDFLSSSTKRRKFGPLGFNIPYEFTDGDLNICISQLKMFLDEYQDIPYKVLKYTAGEINYGGHVTDDWDRRCLLSVLEDFYCPAVLSSDHVYSASGVYQQIDTKLDIKGYLAYICGLPINDTPEIFGLHDNANISFAQNEAFALLEAVVRLQPRATSAGGKTLEEIVKEIVAGIVEKIPPPFDIEEVMEKYPVLYEESMNTVLIQEVIRSQRYCEGFERFSGDVISARAYGPQLIQQCGA